MKVKLFSSLCFAVIYFVIGLTVTVACSCERDPQCSLDLSYIENYDGAVFIGTAEEIEIVEIEYKRNKPDDKSTYRNRVKKIKFSISEILAGKIEKDDYIYTSPSGGNCGYPFEEDKDYLVYATSRDQPDILNVGLCSRTKELKFAKNEIVKIKEFKDKKRVDPIVYGKVFLPVYRVEEQGYRDGVEEKQLVFKIWAKREIDGAMFEVTTDKQGFFEFNNLPQGKYQLTASIDSFVKHSYTNPHISDNSPCWNINFYFNTDDIEKIGASK